MSTLQVITMIFGILGAICITIYAYPPLIRCLKTKDTTGINYPMFIILAVGSTCFILDGLLGVISVLISHPDWSDGNTVASLVSFISVGVANLSSALGAYWSLIYKTIHRKQAKEHQMSEKEWCDHLLKEKNQKLSAKGPN